MAVCNLACEGLTGTSGTPDLAQRKLFIGGLSPDVTSEMLLSFFVRYGDIEEGSVAYDKDTTESRLSVSLHLQILIEIISVTSCGWSLNWSCSQWVWICYLQDIRGCQKSH